jgi:hypothetical protein
MPGSLFTVLAAVLLTIFRFAITAGEAAVLVNRRHISTFRSDESSNAGGLGRYPRAGLSSPGGKGRTDLDEQFYSLFFKSANSIRKLVLNRYSRGLFLLVLKLTQTLFDLLRGATVVHEFFL